MKKTAISIIKTKREVYSYAECDQCKKELKILNKNTTNDFVQGVNLITSHHDWGNDSAESTEEYDFCNMECCLDWVQSNLKKLESLSREIRIECNGKF